MTSTVSERKNFRFKKCWAECLGGCTTMSGEHVFSKSVLKEDWKIRRGTMLLSAKRLTVNNLCRLHNSQLSELDSEASKYFHTMLGVAKHPNYSDWDPDVPTTFSFDGWKLERWFAKTFINMLGSGVGFDFSSKPLFFDIQRRFVEFVFGRSHFPQIYPFGLWIVLPPTEWQKQANMFQASLQMGLMKIFSNAKKQWLHDHQVPQWLLLQFYGNMPVHYGFFNLFPPSTKQIGNGLDMSKQFGIPTSDAMHRPVKIGFDLPGLKPKSNEPHYIFEFDWKGDRKSSPGQTAIRVGT